ncbi:site-2 protease family protein [Nocardioides sp. TRM66260-LWL]|uniref:site-2 protease family protein n=1 Tax=Nocardioides sp. TRM66260-LWL TaxID=2874478 RepID=UPI001CC63F72|nr:site-2 protease family protein [Nocardioides sp. TRM66260-LWL]MBZ5733966.1 site-2 protease family protein [Nocardioides sp. TRM66260-LWL]
MPSSPPAPPRAPRPPGTIRIGSVAGSDVLVSSSWFLVAGLIAVVMAPQAEQVQPGLGAWSYLAGALFAVVLYGSVLLHEAAHALVAKAFGLPVSSITLHFLGGMTAIDKEARRPREEFLIAVVGPLTSLAVGVGALAAVLVVPGGLLELVLEGLAGANLLVGVLNLVPGLPLDGGRVLKSAVWGASGDVHRGTIVAAWGGRVAAVLALLWPVFLERVLDSPTSLLDLALAVLVAGFLWAGATAALRSARLRQRLPRLAARDLARRTFVADSDLPLAEAVRRAREAQAGGIVTVGSDGRLEGIVNEAALLAVPEDRRAWVATATVARRLEPGLVLPARLRGEELVTALTSAPAAEYVLLDDAGQVYGLLVARDVDRAFREVLAR